MISLPKDYKSFGKNIPVCSVSGRYYFKGKEIGVEKAVELLRESRRVKRLKIKEITKKAYSHYVVKRFEALYGKDSFFKYSSALAKKFLELYEDAKEERLVACICKIIKISQPHINDVVRYSKNGFLMPVRCRYAKDFIKVYEQIKVL